VLSYHSHRDLARAIWRALRTLVSDARFLAGTLGSSWFTVLEALQNVDSVRTTRGTAPPGPAPLGIGAVLLVRRASVVEHRLKCRWNSNSRGIRRQHIHLLRMSAFRDFVGALCKLSLEMVRMQSGIDVGAGAGTGEGVLDMEGEDIPSTSTSATSLVTPHGTV
jgi:hypothetical protein